MATGRTSRALRAGALTALAVAGSWACRDAPAVEQPLGAVILNLVEALPEAERLVEVGEIDLGAPSAHRHLISGWSHDEAEDGETFVWGVGSRSVLELFVVEPRDWTLVLDGQPMHWRGGPDQSVSVVVGGRELAHLELGDARDVYEVLVPADAVERGVNRVELSYAYHRAPADVVRQAEDRRQLAVRWYRLGLRGLGAATSPSRAAPGRLVLTGGSTTRFYLLGGATDLWIAELTSERRDGALRVDVAVEGRPVRGHRFEATGGPVRVSLPETPPGEVVQLALTATGVGDSGLELGSPVVYGSLAQTETAPPAPDPSVEAAGRPPVVLYVIDTLRADHLGIYGYELPTSPMLDRFAADAVVFSRAEAQSSWTRTAVASILTGLNPLSHGVNRRDDALAPAHTTLAELLLAAGYQTRAVITNGNVSAQFGLDQGFERYAYLSESLRRRSVHQLSHRINERVDRWLPRLSEDGRPFFLYLHATDPHAPYTPRPPFRQRFAPGVDAELGTLPVVDAITKGHPAPDDAAADLIALYDAEIAYVDDQLGVLFELLRSAGIYDRALIIVVADHGEEFLDHGGWQHGRTLYSEQLRVPLLVKLPGNRFGGTQVDSVARQVDIVPTVLELLGLKAPIALDGRSLLAPIRRPSALPVVSHSHLDLDRRLLYGAATARYRGVVDESAEPAGERSQLYDLEADPRELFDLASERGVTWSALHWLIEREITRERALAPSSLRVTVDEQLRSQLEALGYAQE